MRVNIEYENEYESEYEYESEPEYDEVLPVVKRLSPLEILLEQRKRKEREQLIEKQKKEQQIKDAQEAAVVRPHLRWITATPVVQVQESFADIENEQKQEREWTEVKDKIRRVALPEENYNYKSEMCKTKSKCTKGTNCLYAHSTKELKPLDCQFGTSCRFARIDYRKGTYVNTDNTKRICTRKHPNESKTNFFLRTGIRDPVTVEEMDSDWYAIEKFEMDFKNNNGNDIVELKRRIYDTPCNKTVSYLLHNPVTDNVISYNFTGESEAVEEKKQKIYNYKTEPQINYVAKSKIKNEEMNLTDKINKVSKKLATLTKTLKTNENVISRLSEKKDSEICMKKVESLKIENEQIKNSIPVLEEKINELKGLLSELRKPKKKQVNCWAKSLIPKAEPKPEAEPVVKPVPKFDLSIKSFRLAVSTEKFEPRPIIVDEPKPFPQPVTEPVPQPVSNTKTQLCRSFGKYECKLGTVCKFAHNKDEWNVVKCPYGNRCFDVECIDGVYKNKENARNRICQKLHNMETIENVYLRVGIKEKPLVCAPAPTNDDNTWTLVKHRKPISQNIEKPQICNSVSGNYSCRSGVDCKFAHSTKEWKVMKCIYGERCFDVEKIGGIYRNNKNNKNRICQRQHDGESIKNVYERVGFK